MDKMQCRAVRRRLDPFDGRTTAVHIVGDAPPKLVVEMSPVEQRKAHLIIAQPSLLAGPGCPGDQPGAAGPAGGERLVEQTIRRNVLPRGRPRKDPGTAAHEFGLGSLQDGYVVVGPVQKGCGCAAGDRSP